MRSIFYIFAINIKESESITAAIREQWHDIKKWKTTVNVNLLRTQFSSLFSQSFARRSCRQWFSVSKSAANQNASINKNSKSSNSRNLKQHTFAKSISFCFCFCFAREIDRFIILICRYFSHRSRSRFSTKFSTKFSFSSHISIFLFLAHFLFSNLFLHVYRICFDTFSVNYDQTDIWIIVNEFLRNADR